MESVQLCRLHALIDQIYFILTSIHRVQLHMAQACESSNKHVHGNYLFIWARIIYAAPECHTPTLVSAPVSRAGEHIKYYWSGEWCGDAPPCFVSQSHVGEERIQQVTNTTCLKNSIHEYLMNSLWSWAESEIPICVNNVGEVYENSIKKIFQQNYSTVTILRRRLAVAAACLIVKMTCQYLPPASLSGGSSAWVFCLYWCGVERDDECGLLLANYSPDILTLLTRETHQSTQLNNWVHRKDSAARAGHSWAVDAAMIGS